VDGWVDCGWLEMLGVLFGCAVGFDDCDKVKSVRKRTRAIWFWRVCRKMGVNSKVAKHRYISISFFVLWLRQQRGGMDEISKSSFNWYFINVSQSVDERI
jgi:hypothetical protein